MKIALDVDGVVSEAPVFFATLTRSLRASGHKVYILTDFDEHYRKHREAELQGWGIAYDELVIRGGKERFCREHGIDFAIDDEAAEYYPHSHITTLGLVAVDGARSAPPSE